MKKKTQETNRSAESATRLDASQEHVVRQRKVEQMRGVGIEPWPVFAYGFFWLTPSF